MVTRVVTRVVTLTAHNLRRRTRMIPYDDAALWRIHTCASAVRTA